MDASSNKLGKCEPGWGPLGVLGIRVASSLRILNQNGGRGKDCWRGVMERSQRQRRCLVQIQRQGLCKRWLQMGLQAQAVQMEGDCQEIHKSGQNLSNK